MNEKYIAYLIAKNNQIERNLEHLKTQHEKQLVANDYYNYEKVRLETKMDVLRDCLLAYHELSK